jgi:hemerythrin
MWLLRRGLSGAREEETVAISWYPALEIGNKVIDDQHRELFRRVDMLVEAMMRRTGPEELAQLFDFLGGYVHEHFSAEESLQRIHAYPERAEHEAEHRRFIEDFKALQEEYKKEGPTALLLVRVNARVTRWLVEHVSRTDKAFGAYLATRRIG